MLVMSVMSSMTMMIMALLMTVLNLVSKKALNDREKSSPFECGFDPKSSARMPFSLHFFLIAIIFLVFDIEISIMLPMVMSLKKTKMIMHIMSMTLFITILIIGLAHEWKQGALNWSK